MKRAAMWIATLLTAATIAGSISVQKAARNVRVNVVRIRNQREQLQ